MVNKSKKLVLLLVLVISVVACDSLISIKKDDSADDEDLSFELSDSRGGGEQSGNADNSGSWNDGEMDLGYAYECYYENCTNNSGESGNISDIADNSGNWNDGEMDFDCAYECYYEDYTNNSGESGNISDIADNSGSWNDGEMDFDYADEGYIDGSGETYLGKFVWTYYWIANEEDFLDEQQDVPLYTLDGSVIGYVRDGFAVSVSTEGTGILLDGTIVNAVGECEIAKYGVCFEVVDSSLFPYGKGSWDNPLYPFRTVAADPELLPFGTMLYIPALDGLEIPAVDDTVEAFVHDGCVMVGDVGVYGKHLDYFVLWESAYYILDEALGSIGEVDVYVDFPLCD